MEKHLNPETRTTGKEIRQNTGRESIYSPEVYERIYASIVKRIGDGTTKTITRMGPEEYKKYPPEEALDRLITPIVGLFGRRVMQGILREALSGLVDESDMESTIARLLD
ncbi:MAG: hypothetical protein J7L61_03435 [Thermoplasmata archaeon]|nr:hypothetical protein [Thermoplasmata archaeon]